MSILAARAERPPHLTRSLIAVTLGSLVLRAAAGAMGENIQFYFNAIHDAALNPNHPLRQVIGARVYPISYTMGAVIIATFFAAELIGSLFFGAWSDRYGRKLFIIFGPLFGALAVQITALSTLVWLLIVTRLLEGLSTASNAPATLGYIAESTSGSDELRARAVGLYETATIGGMGLGFSLGGWLWQHFGQAAVVGGVRLTSPAFALNALIYLLSLVILWLGVHEVKERKPDLAADRRTPKEILSHYWAILSSERVARFAPAWIAINAVLGIWINLTARILTDHTRFQSQLLVGRFTPFQAGNIIFAYAACFIIGILIWSFAGAGMRRSQVMLIGLGGLFSSTFFLFAINHQHSLHAPLIPLYSALLVVSIMVQSGFTPAAVAYLADITEFYAEDRGAVMGLYSVFLGLGQFLGLSLGGPFVDWMGADGMVLIVALLGLFAALFVIPLRAHDHAPQPQS